MVLKRVLIIGASQTKYFDGYLQPSLTLEVTVNAVSGRKVQDVNIQGMLAVKGVDHVILHLGTNNIPLEGPAATQRRMESLLKEIRSLNPHCTMYVSSILPRASSFFPGTRRSPEEIEHLNDRSATLNCLYKSLVSRFPNCYFIDNSAHFMEEGVVKRWLLSRDGLHLTPNGAARQILTLWCLDFVIGVLRLWCKLLLSFLLNNFCATFFVLLWWN